MEQLAAFGTADEEWEVDKIISHSGRGDDSLFELRWTNGDVTWEPINRVKGLEALVEYLEAMGVKRVEKLPDGDGRPPNNDPEIYMGVIEAIQHVEESYKTPISPESNLPFQTNPPLADDPKHPTFDEIMSRYNRQYSASFNNTDQRGSVYTRRQGTPYPYPNGKPLRPAPVIREYEAITTLDNYAAVAIAGTTRDVGHEITKAIGAMDSARRAKVTRKIEHNPSLFFKEIGLGNILERTVKSANNNAAPAFAQPVPETPMNNGASELIPIFRDLLAISNLNSALLKRHVHEYNPENPSIDPRLTIAGPSFKSYVTPPNPDYNVDYVFGKITENIDNMDDDMAVTVKEEPLDDEYIDVITEPGEINGKA
jgi:hypothetical protein